MYTKTIFTQWKNIESIIEHLIIEVGNTTYVGAYNRPLNNINLVDLLRFFSSGNRVVLLGDLNSKHPEWDANCNKQNNSGRILKEFAENNDLIIHYMDESTFFPSTFDIAVTKNIPDVHNMTTISTLSSDQDPVYMEIRVANKPQRAQGSFYNYGNTDWIRYRRTLDTNITLTGLST